MHILLEYTGLNATYLDMRVSVCVCVGAYALTNRAVKPRRRRSAAATVHFGSLFAEMYNYSITFAGAIIMTTMKCAE